MMYLLQNIIHKLKSHISSCHCSATQLNLLLLPRRSSPAQLPNHRNPTVKTRLTLFLSYTSFKLHHISGYCHRVLTELHACTGDSSSYSLYLVKEATHIHRARSPAVFPDFLQCEWAFKKLSFILTGAWTHYTKLLQEISSAYFLSFVSHVPSTLLLSNWSVFPHGQGSGVLTMPRTVFPNLTYHSHLKNSAQLSPFLRSLLQVSKETRCPFLTCTTCCTCFNQCPNPT
jgi:hypothetical protein